MLQFDEKMFQNSPGSQDIGQGAMRTRAIDHQVICNCLQAVGVKVEVFTRQQERINRPDRGKFLAEAVELAAHKAQIEGGVVADDDCLVQQWFYLTGNFGEGGCIRQVCIGQPIHTGRAGRDGPGRVDQRIEGVKLSQR